MNKSVILKFLVLLNCCLIACCTERHNSDNNLENKNEIAKDTLALVVNEEGVSLIMFLTEDSIEYGSAVFYPWPEKPLIRESIQWVSSRPHYSKHLQAEQRAEFNNLKSQINGCKFVEPHAGGVKDDMTYYLYRNGKCIVWGYNECYHNFPLNMRSCIETLLSMAGIESPGREFDAEDWRD